MTPQELAQLERVDRTTSDNGYRQTALEGRTVTKALAIDCQES